MTRQEKQLLFKDLCARLPYNIICSLSVKGVDVSITEKLDLCGLDHFIFGTMDVKPYLRSMSSMTEKEKNVYVNTFLAMWDAIDWLNAHHFDYRGLIEKGLAIEAPEDMYKEK